MTLYSTILFIHLIATLGLVWAMSLEAMAVQHLARAPDGATEKLALLDAVPRVRQGASVCLLVLFLSGGYLTDRLSMWTLAWPKAAVLVVFAFGALAGISGKRFSRLQKAGQTWDAQIAPDNVARFLKMSLSLRVGLVLAAVFLMVFKPNLSGSIGAVLGFALIFLGAGLVAIVPKRPATDDTRNAMVHGGNVAGQE